LSNCAICLPVKETIGFKISFRQGRKDAAV
jgi:hypothetical protein